MLTDQAIRAMQPPAKGYRILWDGKLKGFGVRITATGTRAFVVLIASGRPKTIGRYGQLTLAEARRDAKLLLAHKAIGKIHPARTAFTEAVQSYLGDRALRLRRHSLRGYTRLLKHLDYGRTAIADVTPRDILATLRPLPPIEKHHTFAVARSFFRWCVRQHLIDRSPTDTMAIPYNGRPRERVLTPDELKAVYLTCSAMQTPFAYIVSLLILTGARRGEIASLRWEYINEQERTITWPSSATKNKRIHTIPYGRPDHHAALSKGRDKRHSHCRGG